jgi:hypothetical protein
MALQNSDHDDGDDDGHTDDVDTVVSDSAVDLVLI